jgi:hypothetical protein
MNSAGRLKGVASLSVVVDNQSAGTAAPTIAGCTVFPPDNAGLPILPGLVRYDEVVEKGTMNHAVRFTVSHTQHGYVAPASHFASGSTNPDLPPMGLRLRLKSSVDLSGFHPPVQVILRALQRYGMIVADNGSSWFITGERNSLWDNEILDQLKTVSGASFEVVYTGEIVTK